MEKQIDSISQLDLPSLTAADLRKGVMTGRSQSTGSGRDRKYTYRTGILTPLGNIEISVWIEAAEYVVERDGLQEELEHLEPFARFPATSDSPHAKQDARADLLGLCLGEIYRCPEWVGFVPYNQKYHPELLKTTQMAHLIPDCCQRPCIVPKVQICTLGGEPAIPCPDCGRWTTFKMCQKPSPDPVSHPEAGLSHALTAGDPPQEGIKIGGMNE